MSSLTTPTLIPTATATISALSIKPKQPINIIVASTNPIKIAAALDGFQSMFPENEYTVKGISVPSGVPDQPFSDAETLRGALNRARGARDRESEPGVDYWVGIEGGVEEENVDVSGGEKGGKEKRLLSFAWVVVLGREEVGGEGRGKERIGRARTAAYFQPEEVAALVRGGMELGEADDRVFGRVNSKQGNGNVGLLTGDVVVRRSYYGMAVVLALIPFRNGGLAFS